MEWKGKVTGRRVLEAEGPTAETNVSVSGSVRGRASESKHHFRDETSVGRSASWQRTGSNNGGEFGNGNGRGRGNWENDC